MSKTVKNAQGGTATVSDELADKLISQGWVDVNDKPEPEVAPKRRGRPRKDTLETQE